MDGDSLIECVSTLDMPPNAHSVGGGKKKSKKGRTGGNGAVVNTTTAATTTIAANAAALAQAEEVARRQAQIDAEAASLSQEDEEEMAAPQLDVAVSSSEEKAEIEKKKIVHVDQDTEEEEEENELVVEQPKDEIVLLKTSCENLVDLSEESSTARNCSEQIIDSPSKIIQQLESDKEVLDLIASMEKKPVLTDTTNEDKPSAPPRKLHQQTAKVAPNNMTSQSPKAVPFPHKEGIVPRSRNSSISYIKGQVVRPSEPPATTIVGSVAGLMQDVIPKSQSQNSHLPPVERADWVQMFSVEKAGNPNEKQDFLVVGLMRGFQIWSINANGECEEILSMRQGPIRACKILGNNYRGGRSRDPHAGQRPLMAIVDASSQVPDRQYCSVQIFSLVTNTLIHRLTFEDPICGLHTSDRYLVVVLSNCAYVYDFLDKFKEVRTIRTAAPCENCPPSIALTGQILAFADIKLNSDIQSGGGLAVEIEASSSTQYDHVMSAMSAVGRSLKSWGGSVSSSASSTKAKLANGIVTIIDLSRKITEQHDDVLCHWIAHVDHISYIAFSPDQRLVLTSDSTATVYNVFAMLPHPATSTLASVQHLYKLQRGNTPAKICSTAFSLDSRWLSIVTNHGTCHVFAICPFGGKPNQRTHGDQFVNKESRFHRSAGLTDSAEVTAATGQRGASEASIYTKEHPVASMNKVLAKCNTNSRVGPFPPPLCLNAVQKIKDNSTESYSAWASDLASAVGGSATSTSAATNARKRLDVSRVSIIFSSKPQQNNSMGLLFSRADANQGVIMSEFELRPRKLDSTTSTEDIPKLNVSPISVWNLQRTKNNADMHLPMPNGSPLVNLAAISPKRSSHRRPGEEMWTPNVETRTYQQPHRWIWQGPQVSFYLYNEEQSQVLVSPGESSGSNRNSIGYRSIPVMVGGSNTVAVANPLPSDATRIECGSYTSTNSFNVSNIDSQNDITMKIADAMRDVTSDEPTCSNNTDIDAAEEFFDTHSPSLERRGSSKSSSSQNHNSGSTSTRNVTCAPIPTHHQSSQKRTSQNDNDSDSIDDLGNFEMDDEDDM